MLAWIDTVVLIACSANQVMHARHRRSQIRMEGRENRCMEDPLRCNSAAVGYDPIEIHLGEDFMRLTEAIVVTRQANQGHLPWS